MRVFLTGASAGIGLATARALTAAGREVWGTSRQLDRLPSNLPNFHPIALDLNDMRSMEDGILCCTQSEAGGRFDVLINNAGGGWFGPGAQMPPEELRAQFETLAFGPIRLIQLALPAMRAQPGGLVVNVTSLAARLAAALRRGVQRGEGGAERVHGGAADGGKRAAAAGAAPRAVRRRAAGRHQHGFQPRDGVLAGQDRADDPAGRRGAPFADGERRKHGERPAARAGGGGDLRAR